MSTWEFDDNQIAGGEHALSRIREFGFHYIAWQERVRKSGAAIYLAEKSKARSILILTKKAAITGWEEHLEKLPTTKKYVISTYESVHKVSGIYQLVILDESHHAISGFPKKSKTFQAVHKVVYGKPILFMSATPYAEHLGLIYHQLAMSYGSPFRKIRNGYDFHRKFGIPQKTRTPYGLKETYKRFKDDEILDVLSGYIDFKLRSEAGIEHEPSVRVVKIKLDDSTSKLMGEWVKKKLLRIGDSVIAGDSPMKQRIVHYQLEGGTLKTDDGPIYLHGDGIPEKVRYIRENYDLTSLAVMAHFVNERDMLKRTLPGVRILSSDGDAEGIDLSMYKKLVIYSMSFKTSKYTQRLARQANHLRTEPIVVDILVSDIPGIGIEIYDTVAVKRENFQKRSYESAVMRIKEIYNQ